MFVVVHPRSGCQVWKCYKIWGVCLSRVTEYAHLDEIGTYRLRVCSSVPNLADYRVCVHNPPKLCKFVVFASHLWSMHRDRWYLASKRTLVVCSLTTIWPWLVKGVGAVGPQNSHLLSWSTLLTLLLAVKQAAWNSSLRKIWPQVNCTCRISLFSVCRCENGIF